MNVIITMAGDGTRFRNAGYDIPKFAIEVKGRTLINWAVSSLRNFRQHRFIFVARKEHLARPYIEAACRDIGIKDLSILELDEPTAGQAETALLAEKLLGDLSTPIAIYNIDTYIEPHALLPEQIRGAGWVPAFVAPGDHWSFVRCNETGLVSEVAEKRRISEFATIGLYYFDSFNRFRTAMNACSFDGYREKFVAPLYQEFLNEADVYTTIIPSSCVHALGTPEEVKAFLNR